MASDTCEDCGAGGVRVRLGDTPLCDRCADRRVAELTGLPELGAPPAAFVLTGPDGRRHSMQPRPWRAPTGVVVELEETGAPVGEGFLFSVLGLHDADVGDLLGQLRAHAEAEVSRRYLEPNPHRAGWLLAEDEVAGRLVWGEGKEEGGPYDVVVDGRTLTWEEFGHALEIDWVRRVWTIVERDAPWRAQDEWQSSARPDFGPLHSRTLRHEHVTTPVGMVDRIRGVSHVAALEARGQAEVLGAVERLLAEHPDTRGRSELRVPYRVDCFWMERR